MKLYDLPANTNFILRDEEGHEMRLKLHCIDGMYSHCTDSDGNKIFVAAWVDVEIDE